MDDAQFWKLIDASREAAGGDYWRQIPALEALLSPLDPEDLVAFDNLFRQYQNLAYNWDLWAAACIIRCGCSDDGFIDFLAWLISRGQKTYEAALADPDALVEAITREDGECSLEGLQYAAMQVWEQKTGRPVDDLPDGFKWRAEPEGVPWDEDDLAVLEKRFPRLHKRFGWRLRWSQRVGGLLR